MDGNNVNYTARNTVIVYGSWNDNYAIANEGNITEEGRRNSEGRERVTGKRRAEGRLSDIYERPAGDRRIQREEIGMQETGTAGENDAEVIDLDEMEVFVRRPCVPRSPQKGAKTGGV